MINKIVWKTFLPYFKNYKGILFFDLFCASLTVLCEMFLPLIVRFITNSGINNIESLTIDTILKLGVFYLILRIVDACANYYMASVGHIMGAKMETDMRRDLFSHLQKLSFSYYDETKVGQLMSRITSDLFDVAEFAHHCPEEFFIAFIKITVSFLILCSFNVTLTLIIFSILPFMLIFSSHFKKKMKIAFSKSRSQIGEVNSQVEDSLLGVRVVKSFANEDVEIDKFKKGNEAFLDIKSDMYKQMAGFQCTTRFFDGIMYIVVVVVGAIYMVSKKINAGDFTAYLLYVTTLIASIRKIIEFAEQFQRGITGVERFADIMEIEPEIKDKFTAMDIKELEGNIDFQDVYFKYSDSSEYVIESINFSIKKGQNIALVGSSGGGKTTICSLIPRFYEVTEGKITIDGKDIKDLTLRSLRDNIGVVQQDVYLFSGSVYENILYGKMDATMDEVIEAAKKAGADEFIKNLKDGYNTYVGERGVKLSGGQKQRISIARVFLKNPPILILDEATSALDTESEKLVQKSLEELSKNRTTITIAHRLSTILNSDEIFVITNKGIEERGTHAKLLEKGGVYSNLYKG